MVNRWTKPWIRYVKPKIQPQRKIQLSDIGKDQSLEVSAIESIEPSVDESIVTNPVEQAEASVQPSPE